MTNNVIWVDIGMLKSPTHLENECGRDADVKMDMQSYKIRLDKK